MSHQHLGGAASPCHWGTMRTVGVFSQKGGSGKSTLAIHLAVVAAHLRKVLIVDADPQGTVSAWGMARTRPEPLVVRADPSTITEVHAAALREGFDLVLIDCPPHAVPGTAALLRHSDHIITPVQPTMPDIAATGRTVSLAKAAGKSFSFVINRAPARAAEIAQAQQALSALGTLSPAMIGDRRAFSRALADGLAVSEAARGNELAAIEVIRYWRWLEQHLLENSTWQQPEAA